MRLEFEDRGFYAMYPLRATRLQAALKTARGNRKELVEKIQGAIEIRARSRDDTGIGNWSREAYLQYLPKDAQQEKVL